MYKFLSFLLMLALATSISTAQIAVKTDAGDLKITFKGRTHFDAGIYGGDNASAKTSHGNRTNVVRLNDTRIGFIASLAEKWSVKTEVRFTGSNTTFTDVYFGYKKSDKSDFQLGNFWMPFGYETLGPAYRFIQNSSVDKAIDGISRKIGFAYNYNTTPFKFTVGIFSDDNINNIRGNGGFNIASKFIVRPLVSEKTILHLGVAPLFTHTPNTASFNTYSLTQAKNFALIAKSFTDEEQYNIFRGEAEVIFVSGKLYAEARYQHAHINTPGSENAKVGGYYIQSGFLIIGDKQNYSMANGYATNVSAGNLELVARFGQVAYQKNEDNETMSSDITVGLNYGINKYMLARFNWVHGNVKDNDSSAYNAVECRLQFVF